MEIAKMSDNKREQERNELYRTIWTLANELRGSVDGWDFKQYVLGMLFYRYISENLTSYINKGEWNAGNNEFDYAKIDDDVAESIMVILKAYNEYMNGYEDEHGKHIEGYNELVARLVNEFPISSQIIGEDNEKEFIKLFGRILKLRNILRCFDDFESDSSVSVRDLQDYQSIYIDLYQEYAKKSDIEKERINDDIVFEIELIKQVDVNIDYILMLVTKYHESNCEDKTILANINKSIDASVELRSKKALIEGFVAQMTVKTDVEKDWQDFVKKQKEQDLETIIRDEKLKHDEAQKFIENSFRDGGIKTTGTDIDKILPPISRFSGGSNRALKKQTVIDKLKVFFEKYFGVI